LLQDNTFFTAEPVLLVYTRKSDDYSSPFLVGEFHYAQNVFVFIVPFCEKDELDFMEATSYEHFWSNFNDIRKDRDWKFHDFSSTDPIDLKIDFKFKMPTEN
jgi:hypothetical protein